MRIAIDFDGTIVDDSHPYEDLETPLRLLPGARAALNALRAAGHTLVLYSGRSNLALRKDWRLNPLWRDDAASFDTVRWANRRELAESRYTQMLVFVATDLPGIFAYVDDGHQGKVSAELYIDDRGLSFGEGRHALNWAQIVLTYG